MKRILLLFCALVYACSIQARVPLQLPKVVQPVFKKDTLNIVDFGAVGDGITLNTDAINKAITLCNKKGGGVVLIPNGLWLSGPVTLKSNVNLSLDRAATLLFSKDRNLYPIVEGNWEGIPQMRMQSPLSANGQVNIAITGKGTIDGNGDGWRAVKKYQLPDAEWDKMVAAGGVLSDNKETWYPTEQFKKAAAMKNPGAISPEKDAAFFESIRDFLRPNLLVLTRCKKILIDGVTFQNSAAWCLHPLMSEQLTIRNIFIKNPSYAHNGDAIDVESCKNVLIEKSVFDVGDDALCMKSGRDEEGRKRAMPTENVTIRECRVYAAHGGFVVGSEMSGGVKNINVTNCTFMGTDIGLRFKSTRGRGGVVENIFIDNIFMKDIRAEAILLDMYYMAVDPILQAGDKKTAAKVEIIPFDETTPVFRNIHIQHVYCNGSEKAIFVRGLPEKQISDISMQHMVLKAKKGIDLQEADGLKFEDIKLVTAETNPLVSILNSKQVLFEKIQSEVPVELFFSVNGEKSSGIRVMNSSSTNVKQKVIYEAGANAGCLTW
jgi:polygalacturonase